MCHLIGLGHSCGSDVAAVKINKTKDTPAQASINFCALDHLETAPSQP